jgi:hypothetical protein
MTRPVRLRLSRAKGFNLQEYSRATNGLEAVVVTRGPGRKWGNPFVIINEEGWPYISDARDPSMPCLDFEARPLIGASAIGWHNAQKAVVAMFRARCVDSLPDLSVLRGKNLACACELDAPCHADVLLEIANRPICERVG